MQRMYGGVLYCSSKELVFSGRNALRSGTAHSGRAGYNAPWHYPLPDMFYREGPVCSKQYQLLQMEFGSPRRTMRRCNPIPQLIRKALLRTPRMPVSAATFTNGLKSITRPRCSHSAGTILCVSIG